MNSMLRWSPTRQFHFHQAAENLFERFVGGATDEAAQRSSWLPAAEGALPEGVDATKVEAKYANGMLEVRGPAPRAATPRMIEVKAA